MFVTVEALAHAAQLSQRELGMGVVPFTWSVGMGKRFGGVPELRKRQMRVFSQGAGCDAALRRSYPV
jgi:peptide subunit release factor RF-3